MKKITINHNNVNEIVELLNETMEGKRYWRDIANGKINSVHEFAQRKEFLNQNNIKRTTSNFATVTENNIYISTRQ